VAPAITLVPGVPEMLGEELEVPGTPGGTLGGGGALPEAGSFASGTQAIRPRAAVIATRAFRNLTYATLTLPEVHDNPLPAHVNFQKGG
jgi:hypothetical protein